MYIYIEKHKHIYIVQIIFSFRYSSTYVRMHINMCTIQPCVAKVYLRRLPRPTHDASLRGQLSSTFGVSSHHGAPASVGGFSCARWNGGTGRDG